MVPEIPMTGPRPAPVDILQTPVTPWTLAGAAAHMIAAATAQAKELILHRDAHGVIAARRDPRVRAAEHAATAIYPDGMPLVWLCRARGAATERIYGPDLMAEVCRRSAGTAVRHLFLGGGPGVAERLAARFPGLTVAGTLAPWITDPARPDPVLAERINALRPDILWVGLGCPKQDLWMAAHRPLLDVPVMVGCGAAFDLLAGTKPQAPRLVQRAGLEWAFRLMSEPRRLGPRYLRVVPAFALLALAWLVRRRHTSS